MKTIAVHGFMYDPDNVQGPNDPQAFFDEMSKVADQEVEGFGYYSVPFGFKSSAPFYSVYQTIRAWAGSWVRLYPHPYRYAWDQAEKASLKLAEKINAESEPVNIMCHSLGSRVTIQALKFVSPEKINKVIIFNGAELVRNVVGLNNEIQKKILNIAVRTDDVLRFLGARFSGDRNGPTVGQMGVPGWNNIFLDDPLVQKEYKEQFGWDLRGDNPNSLFDHWYSFRFDGNAPLIKWWLNS